VEHLHQPQDLDLVLYVLLVVKVLLSDGVCFERQVTATDGLQVEAWCLAVYLDPPFRHCFPLTAVSYS